jgi:hypothetical protein
MRHAVLVLAPLAAAAIVLGASSRAAIAQPPDQGAGDAGAGDAAAPVPACIAVSTDSRYVPWGYNHVVTLRSSCARPATCLVSTDVNPQVQAVDVASGATVEVVTFMGSPAYTFVARVSCRLR